MTPTDPPEDPTFSPQGGTAPQEGLDGTDVRPEDDPQKDVNPPAPDHGFQPPPDDPPPPAQP